MYVVIYCTVVCSATIGSDRHLAFIVEFRPKKIHSNLLRIWKRICANLTAGNDATVKLDFFLITGRPRDPVYYGKAYY